MSGKRSKLLCIVLFCFFFNMQKKKHMKQSVINFKNTLVEIKEKKKARNLMLNFFLILIFSIIDIIIFFL